MTAWIFQAKPERYKLEKELREGKRETWLVTRYRAEMTRGDVVFFWRAGNRKERGLYGWGRIIDDEPTYYEGWGWGIGIVYKVRFKHFVCVDDIESEDVLSDNLILRMPIGTNFRVSDDELAQLSQMIQQRGENPPVYSEEHGL